MSIEIKEQRRLETSLIAHGGSFCLVVPPEPKEIPAPFLADKIVHNSLQFSTLIRSSDPECLGGYAVVVFAAVELR